MNNADVVNFYTKMENLGIAVWIEGGWGVDALLGRQTRPHKDLDIFIQQKDMPRLREFLESNGYKEIKLEIARPHNFVLGDEHNHEIDVHVIVLDNAGNAIYGPVGNGEIYPATMLGGIGTIDSKTVNCISLEWQVKFHTGYEPRDADYKDIVALCEKFGTDYPKEYVHLKKSS